MAPRSDCAKRRADVTGLRAVFRQALPARLNVGNEMRLRILAAFRQLPLSDAEFRTIADNVAPYMR